VKARRISAKAVIFDWDGTLLNSFHADARAYQAMFRALRIHFGSRELARHYSPDWHRVYRAAKVPKQLWRTADALWAEAYKKEKPRLLPGAKRLLQKLSHSHKLGLVTSGDSERVHRQLEQFGFTAFFQACICSEDSVRRKPHPAPLRKAMKSLAVKAEDSVYIGDTPEDIEMAARAGVRSIGIAGPFPSSARLKDAKPGILVRSISELFRIL